MKRKSIFTKKLILKQFVAASDSYKVNPNHENYKKLVYWSIRHLPYYENDNVEEKFAYISCLKNCLKKLTYREFINLFPIDKEYDGAKWEMKDYYSTIEYLNDKSLDDYIEDPLELIFEYNNCHIIIFGVEIMTVTSDIHRIKTGLGITEAFIYGKEMPHDSKGNIISVNHEGKVCKVSDPRLTKPKLTVIK